MTNEKIKKYSNSRFIRWFQTHTWETVSILAILVIIGVAILQRNEETGSWSESFVYHGGLGMEKIEPDLKEVGKESKGEIMTKNILQDLTRRKWDKIRPDFLKNQVTGQNLEFDCWNEEFGIAVEVQGQQHYKYIPYFHKNYEAFRNQQYRDELKRMMAKNNDIKLIEVPYSMITKDLRGFLRKELNRCGVFV